MKIEAALREFDFDLILRDAFEDRELPLSRRLLAGASIGVELDTGFYAVGQLLEALADLQADSVRGDRYGEGYLEMEDILDSKNPFQMRIWHLVRDQAIGQAVADLIWLRSLAYRRAAMFKEVSKVVGVMTYYTQAQMAERPTAGELMVSKAFSRGK